MTFITVSSLSPQIHAASRVLLFKHRLKIMLLFLYWSLLKLIVMIKFIQSLNTIRY